MNIEREVNDMILDPINRFMVKWTFDHMLSKSAYSVDEMKTMVAKTPFSRCRIDVEGVGFTIRLEK